MQNKFGISKHSVIFGLEKSCLINCKPRTFAKFPPFSSEKLNRRPVGCLFPPTEEFSNPDFFFNEGFRTVFALCTRALDGFSTIIIQSQYKKLKVERRGSDSKSNGSNHNLAQQCRKFVVTRKCLLARVFYTRSHLYFRRNGLSAPEFD